MKIRSTVVLSEEQRGILQIALEIARDKFKDHTKYLLTTQANVRLADQFEKQSEMAEVLLNIITLANEVTVTEETE